jgi:mercuric ion transport protein
MAITTRAQQMMPPEAPPPAMSAAAKWFAALGLAAGLGAVVASSCCAIPFGLAALGAGASILGELETFAAWRIPFLALSALAVVGGWVAWWRRCPMLCASEPQCASRGSSPATLALLLCVSVIVAAAESWSYIDPVLLKLFRGR